MYDLQYVKETNKFINNPGNKTLELYDERGIFNHN